MKVSIERLIACLMSMFVGIGFIAISAWIVLSLFIEQSLIVFRENGSGEGGAETIILFFFIGCVFFGVGFGAPYSLKRLQC